MRCSSCGKEPGNLRYWDQWVCPYCGHGSWGCLTFSVLLFLGSIVGAFGGGSKTARDVSIVLCLIFGTFAVLFAGRALVVNLFTAVHRKSKQAPGHREVIALFEQEGEELGDLIGVWVGDDGESDLDIGQLSILECGVVAPLVSDLLQSGETRAVPNSNVHLNRHRQLTGGTFFMKPEHPAPNEQSGQSREDCKYIRRHYGGIPVYARAYGDV